MQVKCAYLTCKVKKIFNIYIYIYGYVLNTGNMTITNYEINREYYMAPSISHPVSTRDTNIIPRALARVMILVSRVDTGCDMEGAI